MKNNRLGCWSGTSVLIMFATLLFIAGYTYLHGGLLYNPGSLNAQNGQTLGGVTSHAGTGGECKACHTAPWERAKMAERCLDCHSETAKQMQDSASLHGQMLQNSPDLTCRQCHPEHRGANASLTEMDEATFPHDAMGYSLSGHRLTATHQPFACQDCHEDDLSTFNIKTCQDCHANLDAPFTLKHSAEYGEACLACHDGVDRFGKNFSHDAKFALTGGHNGLTCVQCHSTARTADDFKTAPSDCYACHREDDPHLAAYGTDCASCHQPSAWSEVTFDHSRSNFPLTGKHANLTCEQCHINSQFAGLPTTCVSCHAEPAYHAGAFGTDCAACHTTTAWTPASFNGQHTFPLDHGEGGNVSCVTCHPNSFTAYTCYGCHEHSETKISAKHIKEGISDFQNCMECHPNGNKHEGKYDDD